MANAAKMAATFPVRMLLTGYPGAGKTGSIAALANAGFKIRLLDFDGNPESLLQYTKPQFLQNIDILSFEDPLGDTGGTMGVKGIPKAFVNAVKAMDNWKYEENGKEISLGASRDWGQDTIVVLDGLTGLGKACMRRAMAMTNKTPLNMTQQTWGIAIQEQESFIERLTAAGNRHHVVVISHLAMIGPKSDSSADSQLTKDIKEAQAELVPTRLYPSALGWKLPQSIAQHFPVCVTIGVEAKSKTVKRSFYVEPRPDMDLKLPTSKTITDLGVENGILGIFSALGHPKPIEVPCTKDGEAP